MADQLQNCEMTDQLTFYNHRGDRGLPVRGGTDGWHQRGLALNERATTMMQSYGPKSASRYHVIEKFSNVRFS